MTQELEKQIKHINNSLFAAKMENIIQYMYEEELKTSVAGIFHSMRTEILKNLEEYYGDVLFNAHMDLILAPIHEHHKQYYDTIMKYKLKEHRKGRVQGKRLITRAKQYAKQYSKAYYGGAVKDDTINVPMSSIIKKDELFATSDYSAEQMRDKTFVASENTLARVDKDINGIITDGYRDGWGINDVTNKINTRFDQLETWEAQRIARTEIHGSHMKGVMKSYEDMGVEYTQWASAHDNRTRDTHIEIDGEIIPFGGVFSNGLRYPGDTNGAISEWINCRCGCLPWFCPPGFMVPVGMSNFRESDLIPTHAFQTTEDRIKEILTSEVVENQLTQPMPSIDLSPKDKEQMKKWYEMFSKVEKHDADFYGNTLKPRYLNRVEESIYHTKELSHRTLVDLEALKKYYPNYYNKLVKEVSKELDYNRLTLAQRRRLKELKNIQINHPNHWKNMRKEVREEVEYYMSIARDTNIHTEKVTINLSKKDFDHMMGSEYYTAKTETFMKYNFRDKNYSIYISEEVPYDYIDWYNYSDVIKMLEEQPEIIEDSFKRVFVSYQRGIQHKPTNQYVGGWSDTKGNIITFVDDIQRFKVTLSHEAGHNLEEGIRKISKDPDFVSRINFDMRQRREGKIAMTPLPKKSQLNPQANNRIWISDYAEHPINSKNTDHIETWADCVAAYVHEPEWFRTNYRKTYEYIDKMFKDYQKSPSFNKLLGDTIRNLNKYKK